jgi:hypothetical protein
MQSLHQARYSGRSASGCQNVIDDEHVLARA